MTFNKPLVMPKKIQKIIIIFNSIYTKTEKPSITTKKSGNKETRPKISFGEFIIFTLCRLLSQLRRKFLNKNLKRYAKKKVMQRPLPSGL
jgi:hypothetical protein